MSLTRGLLDTRSFGDFRCELSIPYIEVFIIKFAPHIPLHSFKTGAFQTMPCRTNDYDGLAAYWVKTRESGTRTAESSLEHTHTKDSEAWTTMSISMTTPNSFHFAASMRRALENQRLIWLMALRA